MATNTINYKSLLTAKASTPEEAIDRLNLLIDELNRVLISTLEYNRITEKNSIDSINRRTHDFLNMGG